MQQAGRPTPRPPHHHPLRHAVLATCSFTCLRPSKFFLNLQYSGFIHYTSAKKIQKYILKTHKEYSGPNGLTGEFFQIFKEEIDKLFQRTNQGNVLGHLIKTFTGIIHQENMYSTRTF